MIHARYQEVYKLCLQHHGIQIHTILYDFHNSSKIGFSPPQQPCKLKITTTTQPTAILTTVRLSDTTIIIAFIINTTISLTIIHWILQSKHNPVYPTIFILINNLITYKTLRTNHLNLEKHHHHGQLTPKCLDNQSNLIPSIHRRVKVKRPKKLQ